MMSDFSDKYRRALDEMDISPDFKERTAEKMKSVRDGKKNISLYRTLSAIAAAAACTAAVIAAGKAGVFDDAAEIVVNETAEITSVTEATDIITDPIIDIVTEESLSESVHTEAAITEADGGNVTSAEFTSSEETVPETFIVTSAATEAVTTTTSETVPFVTQHDIAEAEYVPPASYDEDAVGGEGAEIEETPEDDSAETEDGSDSAADESEATFKMARGADFSAQENVSAFAQTDAMVIITPMFGDGNAVEFTSPQIIERLIYLLAGYAADGTGVLTENAPAAPSYIIDFSDEQGNALRVCIGVSYAAFSAPGDNGLVYYTFELTDEERAEIENVLYEYTIG